MRFVLSTFKTFSDKLLAKVLIQFQVDMEGLKVLPLNVKTFPLKKGEHAFIGRQDGGVDFA